jgi:hypothetical protein
VIIILNNNPTFNSELTGAMINVQSVNDILDLQIKLSEDDAECDLLLIDLDLTLNQTDILINWIVKHNPFIKRIILYYDEKSPTTLTLEDLTKYITTLKRAQYKANLMPFGQLYEGLIKYENE